MPITPISFSPSTKALSGDVNANFTEIANAINNLRPTLYAYLPGSPIVDTNVGPEYKMVIVEDLTIVSPSILAKIAPTGADLIIDIKKNGVSIFSTKPKILAGQTSDDGGAVLSTTTVANGDILTYDITQVGSTVRGSDITVGLTFRI